MDNLKLEDLSRENNEKCIRFWKFCRRILKIFNNYIILLCIVFAFCEKEVLLRNSCLNVFLDCVFEDVLRRGKKRWIGKRDRIYVCSCVCVCVYIESNGEKDVLSLCGYKLCWKKGS